MKGFILMFTLISPTHPVPESPAAYIENPILCPAVAHEAERTLNQVLANLSIMTTLAPDQEPIHIAEYNCEPADPSTLTPRTWKLTARTESGRDLLGPYRIEFWSRAECAYFTRQVVTPWLSKIDLGIPLPLSCEAIQ